MSAPLVLLHASVPPATEEALRSRYQVVDAAGLDAVRDRVRVVVTNGEAIVDAALIGALPALELVANFGVGYDGVDTAAAGARGITVTNTPDMLTEDVADLAIGLMLAGARRIPEAGRFIERGDWKHGGFPWTTKVSGARLDILGLGRIGRAIAERAQAFGMPVSYVGRRPDPEAPYPYVADPVTLAAQSDFLIVCVPGGAQTRAVVDRAVLRALGPSGFLVNISRGSNIDQDALIDALDAGEIAGAALDVFVDEPHVPASLLDRPNVVVTPHIGSATHQTRARMSALLLENIDSFLTRGHAVTPVPLEA